jgi:hypothetical protein
MPMKRALIAAAAAVALTAGVPGVASAAASTWTFQTAPAAPYNGYNQMGTVSCGTSSYCIATFSAVGGGIDTVDTWNGTTWSQVTLPDGAGYVGAGAVSCFSATACTVAGTIPFSNDSPAVAQWNGTSWTGVALPDPDDVMGALDGISCPTATACVAVGGGFGTESWSDGAWTETTAQAPAGAEIGWLKSVSCASPDACVAVGYYLDTSDGPAIPVAESWNGSTWTIQTTPALTNTQLRGVSCASATNCSAVGADYGSSESSPVEPVALHWNGSTWTQETVPLSKSAASAFLDGVSCATTRGCTAVGQYNAGPKNTSLALAEVWNGSRWMAQATAPPAGNKSLVDVSCLAARTCTAVGSPEGSKPNKQPVLVEHEG